VQDSVPDSNAAPDEAKISEQQNKVLGDPDLQNPGEDIPPTGSLRDVPAELVHPSPPAPEGTPEGAPENEAGPSTQTFPSTEPDKSEEPDDGKSDDGNPDDGRSDTDHGEHDDGGGDNDKGGDKGEAT
jgi:hypothetical protein